jgi:hypothetical protein
MFGAWDHAGMQQDDEGAAVVRAAAGRLILLELPRYSPWLNPSDMLWRHCRREVTQCERFASVKALLPAAQDFFDHDNRWLVAPFTAGLKPCIVIRPSDEMGQKLDEDGCDL